MAPMPVSTEDHGAPHFLLITWLGLYHAGTPGTQGGDNSTLKLDLKNVPQPDAFLRILPSCGGQSRTVDGYVEGAPELTAEIAASSENYDLHDKLQAYRRNGVCEYVVWRVLDREIDWFILRDGEYERLSADADGICRSEVFPGLWLEPNSLISGELGPVLDVLQRGLATPEHAAFVERLRAARR